MNGEYTKTGCHLHNRSLISLLWLVFLWLGVLSAPQQARGQTIVAPADVMASKVWNLLGIPYPYDVNRSDPALTAYTRLNKTVSFYDQNGVVLPGMFVHLVKEAVMVNAALVNEELINTNQQPLTLASKTLFRAMELVFKSTPAWLPTSNYKLGSPRDPNEMAGPVACKVDLSSSNSARFENLAGPAAAAPLAIPPYCYTVDFQNIGRIAETSVFVQANIDTRQQNIATFALSDITWGSAWIYPTSYLARTPGGALQGPFPIPAGSLAPVPPFNWTYIYNFPPFQVNGPTPQMQVQNLGGSFTWIFLKNQDPTHPGITWSLPPRSPAAGAASCGSVSFLIRPFGTPPIAGNISDPYEVTEYAATVEFITAGSKIWTNPWLPADF